MAFVLSWLQMTVICYLASALLSPPSLFGSAILPWWSWGLLIALNNFHNAIHLKRQSRGLTYVISDLVFFLAFGVGALGYFQQTLSGRFWPNSFMNLIVAFVVIASLGYSSYKPPTEKLRTQLWELGIIASSYATFLGSHYQDIPNAFTVPLIVIATGLLRQGLRPRQESVGVIRTSQASNRFSIGMILLLLASFIALLSLIGFASNKSIGQAINSFFMSVIAFYNQFGHETLNKPTKFMPFIPNTADLMAASSSNGSTAPLWYMMILWIILGLSLILLIIFALIRFYEFIQFLRTWSQDPVTRKEDDGLDLVPSLRKFFAHIPLWFASSVRQFKHLALLLAFQIGISPKDIQGLYSYFLWWGGSARIKRRRSQTIREYQKGLQRKMLECDSALVSVIERLTVSYERYCYGGDPEPLSAKEIKEVHETLAKYRHVIRKVT